MARVVFLVLTALTEAGTGFLLILLPSVPLALLLGIPEAAPETLFVGRIAGAALLAIGIASWLARNDERSQAQIGLLIGILLYDSAAAGLLACAGLFLNLGGFALWPAVVLHSTLAVWCVLCLRGEPGIHDTFLSRG